MIPKLLTIVVTVGAFCTAGCAKKSAAPPAANPPATAPSAATGSAAGTAAAPGGARTIEITANDTMKYDTMRIEAAAGEAIHVVLRNTGMAPKASMGHNFVVLKKGASPEAFVAAGGRAGLAKDYFPAELLDQVIAHTKLIGPREKAEVTFNAPNEPGEYVYLCSFPAHYQVGMKGVLVVK